MHISLPIFGLIFMLLIAVLLVPLAKMFNFPSTVLLALTGIGIGIVSQLGSVQSDGIVSDLMLANAAPRPHHNA